LVSKQNISDKEKKTTAALIKARSVFKKYMPLGIPGNRPKPPPSVALTPTTGAIKPEEPASPRPLKIIKKETEYLTYLKDYPWDQGGHPYLPWLNRGGATTANKNYCDYQPDFMDTENINLWTERERHLAEEFDSALTRSTDLFEYIELRRTSWNPSKEIRDLLETQGARPLIGVRRHPMDALHHARKIPQHVFQSLVTIIFDLKMQSIENSAIVARLRGDRRAFLAALKCEPVLLKTVLGAEIMRAIPFFDSESVGALGRALQKTPEMADMGDAAYIIRAFLLVLYYEVQDIDLLTDKELIPLFTKSGLGINDTDHREIFNKYRNAVKKLRVRDVFRKNLAL